jgi:hypothetical protein
MNPWDNLTPRQLRMLRKQNVRRLLKLGLPDNLFEPDFWEKEMAARKVDAQMLQWFEDQYKAGKLGANVPWLAVFARWREDMARPLYFASMGKRPRWVDALNDAKAEWRARENGRRKLSWAKSSAVQNLKEKAARLAGK